MQAERKRARRFLKSMLVAAVVAATLQIGGVAEASFPGTNGLIAYLSGDNVFVVNPTNPVPMQVTNTGGYTSLGYNAAGNKLVAAGAGGLVLLEPVSGSGVTVVPNTSADDVSPVFSPDGSKLAFASAGTGIFTIDVNGSNRTNIREQGARPDWSPDGSFIAFDNDAGTAILRMSPSGGSVVTLAKSGPAGANACKLAPAPQTPCLGATISPDGRSVAFSQRGAATTGLARVNADGTTTTPIRLTTGNGDHNPSFAPDGSKLAFARGAIGAGALSTVPADGSGTVTTVGSIGNVGDTWWGVGTGTSTGTGTGTGTGSATISVSAARDGKVCDFPILVSPAGKTGVTVDYTITNAKGKVKDQRNDVAVPVTINANSKKTRIITLSDAKGATLATSTATCAK